MIDFTAEGHEQPRTFEITPKTTLKTKKNSPKDMGGLLAHMGIEERNVVINDMILNAGELTGSNATEMAQVAKGAKLSFGLDKHLFAFHLGSFMGELGLSMSSPEAVYMSGHFVRLVVNLEAKKKEQGIRELKSDENSEVSGELKESRETVDCLNKFESKLITSMGEYAQRYLPDPMYRKAIQNLTFAVALRGDQRNKVLALLKKKEINQVCEILGIKK